MKTNYSNNRLEIGNSINLKSTFRINYYFVGFLFAFLSSIRMPFLPEFQLILFAVTIIFDRKISFNTILLLATILCTHHYVVPDYVWRFNSSEYPSIYTRAYVGIKLLDILVVLLFIVSVPLFIRRNVLKIFYIKGLPTILFLLAFLGFNYLNNDHFALEQFLFIIRSYILFISIFILCLNFSTQQYYNLSRLIIFCWIIKMTFAILIPHPHPLWRSILGLDGAIFFAGDEYLTIPYYLSILILTNNRIEFKTIKKCILYIFILTMISQRKGAIPVLIGFYLIVLFYQNKNRIGILLMKVYYVFNAIFIYIFLYNVPYIFSDPLIILAFDEYSNFAHVAIDSLKELYNTDIYNFLCGITPFGKYEIVNLPSYMDHEMSFGKEVGEAFRYQFWSFPFDRCILNTGFIGFVLYLGYRISAIKYNLVYMFLLMSSMSVCYYYNMTPVNAFAMGITFAFLYNYQNLIYEKNYIL